MKSFKSRLLSGVGAALVAFSLSATSMATWSQPSSTDVTYCVSHISAECTKLLALVFVNVGNIKIVNVENVLSGDDLVDVENSLNNLFIKLQIANLHNVLNGLTILNGSNVLTFGDVLSNNNVDMADVIGAKVFPDGKLLVFYLIQ